MEVYWFIGTCCVKTKSNLDNTCLRTLGNRQLTIFFVYVNNYFTTKRKEKQLKLYIYFYLFYLKNYQLLSIKFPPIV